MRPVRLPAAALLLAAFASGAAGQRPAPGSDVFAVVRALDAADAERLWPGFRPSEWPLAVSDGEQTFLFRHPAPPPGFVPVPGHSGVLVMPGRHPAVVANSTREIGGTRTATVIVTPGQGVDGSLLACIEEVFHVFWLRRHADFRPDEMTRYAYPVTDLGNLRGLLAEAEALARALEANDPSLAAGWAAAAIRIRRDRLPRTSDEDRAYETGLEMMEGTANYVARLATGQKGGATAARLRSGLSPDQIRWRFYESGTAICFLLDRFRPDWKTRIEAGPGQTTAGLLEAAVAGQGVPPAEFSGAEALRFEERAASGIAELSARQRATREDLLGRSGPRIVVEVAGDADPLRVTRFDPINLLVLDAGEVVHPNFLTLSGPNGTIELTNPAFMKGSFEGTVAVTRGAGRNPVGGGVRTLTVVGVRGTPHVDRRDGRLRLEADGVRVTLDGAELDGGDGSLRIRLPARAGRPGTAGPAP